MGAVVASGGVLLGTYTWMLKNVVAKKEEVPEKKGSKAVKKKKVSMSLGESAKFLMSSPYIRNLATLVVSYGMCINLVEVSWKSKLKVRATDFFHVFEMLGCFNNDLTCVMCSSPSQIQMITQPSWATSLP